MARLSLLVVALVATVACGPATQRPSSNARSANRSVASDPAAGSEVTARRQQDAKVLETVRSYWATRARVLGMTQTWDEATARAEYEKVATGIELSDLQISFKGHKDQMLYLEGTIVSHPRITGHAGDETLIQDCVDNQTRSYYADDHTRGDDDDPFWYTYVLRVKRTADGYRVIDSTLPTTACKADQVS